MHGGPLLSLKLINGNASKVFEYLT